MADGSTINPRGGITPPRALTREQVTQIETAWQRIMDGSPRTPQTVAALARAACDAAADLPDEERVALDHLICGPEDAEVVMRLVPDADRRAFLAMVAAHLRVVTGIEPTYTARVDWLMNEVGELAHRNAQLVGAIAEILAAASSRARGLGLSSFREFDDLRARLEAAQKAIDTERVHHEQRRVERHSTNAYAQSGPGGDVFAACSCGWGNYYATWEAAQMACRAHEQEWR